MVWRLAIVLAIVLHGATNLQAQLSANGQMTVRWSVPKEFPTGLQTVVPGTLSGSNPGGRTFLLHRSGQPDIPAQRVVGTHHVWFIAKVSEPTLGKTLEFRSTKYEGKAAVTIARKKDGFQFSDDGQPVMFYQREPKSKEGKSTRANYIHPLFGLDGELLTQDFPDDHLHHRGVFWAWRQLYVGKERAGDPWINRDFLSVVKEADIVDQGPVFATLRVTVDWVSPQITDDAGKPMPIVRETTRIRLFHAAAESRFIDFEIRLKPLLPDVKIGGAENARGYSGFTVRVKPPREIELNDANGFLKEDSIGNVSRWADVSGLYDQNQGVTGVAILSHPSLPEFPPKWLLRHYGMQNVVYPGRQPIALWADKPLVLRHRLVIHRGNVKKSRIPDHQKVYEAVRRDLTDP